MGIIIDYKGKLADLSRIDGLVRDVKAFCEAVQWEYEEISEHLVGIRQIPLRAFSQDDDEDEPKGEVKKPERTPATHPDEFVLLDLGSFRMYFDQVKPDFMEETMRGIYCYPPGTESVQLTFDGQGNLCHHMDLGEHLLMGKFKDVKHYWFIHSWTKTTGAIEEHKRICKLLWMIRDKYIPNLKVSDHTGYYDSQDEAQLRRDQLVMTTFLGALRESPSVLKKALDLPEDAKMTDITDEFNESRRGNAKAARAAGGGKKTPKVN